MNYTIVENPKYGGWAGYILRPPGNNSDEVFEGIKTSFNVPYTYHTNLSTNQGIAIWIGIGGYLTVNLIQVGIEADNLTAEPSNIHYSAYKSWYDLFPFQVNTVPFIPSIGENLTVSIRLVNATNNIWQIFLMNSNNGLVYYNSTVNFRVPLNTAEAIVEVPNLSEYSPPAFSPIEFRNISTYLCTRTNCKTCPLDNMSHISVGINIFNSTNPSQKIVIEPSKIFNNSFSVYYNGTLPENSVSGSK
ncbi:MAG: G1 family glutamic endopeptidase [Candidatus Micrarchaeaceae archaeon]